MFVRSSDYTSKQLEEILAHEEVHVRQKHTWDVLLSQGISIVYWNNPVSWLLKQAIRENLEFLADAEVIRQGYNRKDYLYHLLCLSSVSGNQVALINPFNISKLFKNYTIILLSMILQKASWTIASEVFQPCECSFNSPSFRYDLEF